MTRYCSTQVNNLEILVKTFSESADQFIGRLQALRLLLDSGVPPPNFVESIVADFVDQA